MDLSLFEKVESRGKALQEALIAYNRQKVQSTNHDTVEYRALCAAVTEALHVMRGLRGDLESRLFFAESRDTILKMRIDTYEAYFRNNQITIKKVFQDVRESEKNRKAGIALSRFRK